MAGHVIVVMSPPGEANPGDQGRMVHAMTLARDLRAAGQQVGIFFHGVGTRWLANRLGVKLVGGLEEHHSAAAQLVQGDQLHTF